MHINENIFSSSFVQDCSFFFSLDLPNNHFKDKFPAKIDCLICEIIKALQVKVAVEELED